MLCAPQNPPSAQPAQEKARGHSCPALSSQLFPSAQPPAHTLGEVLMLPSSPCQPGGACLLHLLIRWDLTPVKEEAFGLTNLSKAGTTAAGGPHRQALSRGITHNWGDRRDVL